MWIDVATAISLSKLFLLLIILTKNEYLYELILTAITMV